MIEPVLLLLWSARSLRALLRAVSFWQAKEYRLDRVRAHWRLPSAWQELYAPRTALKVGLAVALVLAGENMVPLTAAVLLALVWGYETGWFVYEVAGRSFTRPHPTVRALLVLLAGAALVAASAAVLFRVGLPLAGALLWGDLTLPLLAAAAVAGSSLPARAQRRRAFATASTIIRTRPELITIGITGSYGKTSTKEFLATLLSERFRVQSTPAHVNTEIGIANVVRRRLRPDTEVFVCELGAYRIGEIARAAAIVRPRVGILTAISDQHLALFGSQDAIVRAKGELLRALPPEGTAIINGDQALCEEALRGVSVRHIMRFGHGPDADIRAEAVTVGERSLTLRVAAGEDRTDLTVPLLGHLQVPNLLAAIAAARTLGLSAEEIVSAARGITPLPRTMEPMDLQDGTLVIDDSYSANPDGVLAAIEVLQHVPRARRAVMLAPMIEPGARAGSEHQRVGERLAALQPERIVFTGSDFANDLAAGIGSFHPERLARLSVAPTTEAARALLRPLRGPDAVILIEGRVPEALRVVLRA